MSPYNKKTQSNQGKSNSKVPVVYLVIVFIYVFLPFATPDLGALNSNGPKFLFLQIFNLLVYTFLISRKNATPGKDIQPAFYRNIIGIFYLLLFIVSILSVFKAINLDESLLSLSKLLSVIMAAYNLSVVFQTDKRLTAKAALYMTLLLIIDCVVVFYGFFQYIAGTIHSVLEIASVYTNKNMLTAAIFIKIPFAIYLLLFSTYRWKNLLFVVLFCAFLSIFLLSTRAFYLGLFITSFLFICYLLILFLKNKRKDSIVIGSGYIIALLFALILHTLIATYLLPKNDASIYNKTMTSRMETLEREYDQGTRKRAWLHSYYLLKDNPMLGVGIGNWKVASMKYESPATEDYRIFTQVHNDFLECASETGVPGGILFAGLFILISYSFVRRIGQDPGDEKYQQNFLAAAGMIFYSFDAFFNFPSDRTEIQSLFAFFIAMGIVSSGYKMLNFQFPGKYMMLIRGITFLFIFSSIYFLYQNLISLRYQELAAREIQENYEIYKRNDFNMRFKIPANYFIQGFPAFPDLGTKGEPIDVYKARYLIYEKRYQEAIDLLKNNQASPYNPRKEYFVALAYFNLGNMDSALVYANQVKLMKPKNFMTYGILHEIYAARGDMKNASGQFEEYLRISRKNNLAWNNLSIDFERMGDLNKALSVLDSGLRYLPGDTLLLSSRAYINKRLQTYPYEDLYARAVQYFENQDYLKATVCFSDFINKKPGFIDAYAYRGMCFYNQKNYLEGARDLDTYLEKDSLNNKLYNIRGICYLKLGQNSKACNDFLKGMNGGDQDAKSNYSKFCSKKP